MEDAARNYNWQRIKIAKEVRYSRSTEGCIFLVGLAIFCSLGRIVSFLYIPDAFLFPRFFYRTWRTSSVRSGTILLVRVCTEMQTKAAFPFHDDPSVANRFFMMPNTIPIENIEELRRTQGIDDVELRLEIRDLRAGDFVRLTFLIGASAFETLLVRITSIRGSAFRGKLVKRASSQGLSELEAGAKILFTTAHIHSLLKREAAKRSED